MNREPTLYDRVMQAASADVPRPGYGEVAAGLGSASGGTPASNDAVLQRPLRPIARLPGLAVESALDGGLLKVFFFADAAREPLGRALARMQGDRSLALMFGDNRKEPLRVFLNGEPVRELGLGALARTLPQDRRLAGRPARVLSLPRPNDSAVALEVTLGAETVLHTAYGAGPAAETGRDPAQGALLGQDDNGDLIGWMPREVTEGADRPLTAVLDGAKRQYLACHTVPDDADGNARDARLYRIPLWDLSGGIRAEDGSLAHRVFLFTTGTRRPHRRGVFNLLRTPGGPAIWWRLTVTPSGAFTGSALRLDAPATPITLTVESAGAPLWSGQVDGESPPDFFPGAPSRGFAGIAPELAHSIAETFRPAARRIVLRFDCPDLAAATPPLPMLSFSAGFRSLAQLRELGHLPLRGKR